MKVLLCFCLIVTSSSAFAQLDDLLYKFDAHAGYSLPLGKNFPIKGGLSIGAEPKFWSNDDLVLGAKLGINFLNSPASNVTLAPLTTIALVGEQYTEESELRFFYGGSIGLYLGGQTKKIDGLPITNQRAERKLGLAPRVGVQFGQYRLMGELHFRKNSSKFISIMLGYTFSAN